MITNLDIKNFKSIEDSGIIEFKPLTIFTGSNSSGKSNILEGVAILAQTNKLPSRDITPSLAGSLREGELFKYPYPPYDFIAHKRDLNRQISFSIHVKTNNYEASEILKIAKKYMDLSERIPKEPITSVGFAYSYRPTTGEVFQGLFINEKKFVETALIETAPKSWKCIVTYPEELKILIPQRSPEEMLNPECFRFVILPQEQRVPPIKPLEKPIFDIEEIRDGFSSTSNEIIKIIANRFSRVYLISTARGLVEPTVKTGTTPSWVGKHGEHLVQILALCFGKREYTSKAEKIANWAEKFGVGKVKAGWWGSDILSSDYEDPLLKTPLSLALASYGSRQLLTIITQIFWGEPGDIIMIEEPEISLHPESQVLLQELFAEAVNEGKQIIYTTHSPFLILALSRVVRRGKLSRDDIAIYHVEKSEAGTKLKRLELNEHGFVTRWIPSYLKVEDELFREWAESLEEE